MGIAIDTYAEGWVVLCGWHGWVDCHQDEPPLEWQWIEPEAVLEAIHRFSTFTVHSIENIPERITNRRLGRTPGLGSRERNTKGRTKSGLGEREE